MVAELSALVSTAAAADGATVQAVVEAYVTAAETMLGDDLADNIAIGDAGADDILTKLGSGAVRCSDSGHQLLLSPR